MTILQQCDLLSLSRSTYYYLAQPESPENLRLLRRLDELYMLRPYYGSRRMAVELEVNRKRIQRLMRILGIEAIYPKPHLSRPAPGHQIYPYLLRGIEIPAQPGLEHRYYLHSDAWRLPVPSRRHGWVPPFCAQLGVVQYHGGRLLPGAG